MLKEFSQMGRVMNEWYRSLEPIALKDLIPDEEAAKHTFLFSADMIKGFCKKGNLASPRIDAISKPIAALFTKLYEAGVPNFVLIQEWHDPEAKEFQAFPAHGIRETEEAETIPELAELAFADRFIVFLKNSISPAWAYREKRHKPPSHTHPTYPEGFDPVWRERFEKYLETNDIRNAIFVGNCTDLCVEQAVMYVKLWANERQKDMRVVIPANCVQTFDLPIVVAEKIGATPHPGDMYHQIALYEMARNKIEIVREIA